MHKISCLIPDYYINNINFVKNRRNWPMNLSKSYFIFLSKMFPKSSKLFNKNIEFSHDVSQRNVTAAKIPPPPDVKFTFLVGKIDMRGFPKQNPYKRVFTWRNTNLITIVTYQASFGKQLYNQGYCRGNTGFRSLGN